MGPSQYPAARSTHCTLLGGQPGRGVPPAAFVGPQGIAQLLTAVMTVLLFFAAQLVISAAVSVALLYGVCVCVCCWSFVVTVSVSADGLSDCSKV